ncbi:MAG TPA: PLP-dependent aminotransferase family protein [Trebonia sp.]|nr:PLP-dependent aminotransferase family protein [Trebonia sp.]
MAIQWSGLGPELLLRLDRGSGEPLRSQLEAGLRDAIRGGRLQGGERLPSSRELARELGTSRGLVQECYSQLLSEGYLTSQIGSATRVAMGAYRTPAPAAAPAATPRLIADFRVGVPDLASFPRGDWVWATREACGRAATADLGYGDPRGSAVLRGVLAPYLRRVRAAAADPGQLVVSTGFAQGIILVLRVLAQASVRCAAFEDPGYGGAEVSETVQAVVAMGMRAVHVPVDDLGIDVEALERSGAQVVVVTPAHQSPTGVVLAAARRHALIDWARGNGAFIVEDDYDSEFRYDREPVGVLQGLAPDRVFTIGTASKALAPAVRLGWILGPPSLAAAVAAEKRISDRGSSTLDQLALAALLESGRYDRHLRRMRTVYAGRRAALIAALARHAPGIRLTGLAAGFHAVAHLPAAADEQAVVAAARERQVGLYGMSDFRAVAAGPPQLVLGFGQVPERAIEPGIAAVADLLECPTRALRSRQDRRGASHWKRLPGNRVMAAG